MNKRLRLILIGGYFALVFVFFGINIYISTVDQLKTSTTGIDIKQNTKQVRVDRALTENPAAAVLRDGDELAGFNGQPFVIGQRQISNFERSRPGTPYTVTVQRDGQLQEFELRTVPIPLVRVVVFTGLGFLLFTSFLFTGFIVLLLKPDDKLALLLALMLGIISGGGYSRETLEAQPIYFAAAVLINFLRMFVPVIFLHFFLVFPERSPLLRRFPRFEWMIYPLWFLLSVSYSTYIMLLDMTAPERVYEATQRLIVLGWTETIASLIYVFGGLISLIVNYRQASKQSRRKLRVVLFGTLAGLLPLLGFVFVNYFYDPPHTLTFLLIIFLVSALQLLVPLSFAYAIVRHQVIPVSLIIRRGVRYVLVSRGSILLEAVAVFVVLTVFLTAFFRYLQTSSYMVVGVTSGIVAVAVYIVSSAIHHRAIAPAIDRRFFREAYDAHEVLAELTQSVRTVTSVRELLESVAAKLQQALHTQNVHVFLQEGEAEAYVCRVSTEYNEDVHRSVQSCPDFAFKSDSFVVKRLSRSAQPLAINFSDPNSWLHEMAATYPIENKRYNGEQQQLQNIKSALLLPLLAKNRMLGFVSLGARLGDLPFSNEDERLLVSVAAQTSFALENARLVEGMIVEERRRKEVEAENEQRAKELEEARQLQFSMLPKCVPQLPDLDIAVYMKPAAEVGGDYYDFHVAEDGTLTVAIGDATGHGLKAGTMVTATKGLFSAFAHEPEIPNIFKQSSQALKRMNLRPLYMAMTIIKVKDRCLTVSAAGMPPMLVYRATSGCVEEVAIKGMPLGSVANFLYKQRELKLSLGDTVLLMSDGFPERFNQLGEMIDYEHAKKMLSKVAERATPGEIIQHFVETGEAWADGRPQDDDVTFVVLKVKAENGRKQ